VLSLYGGDDDTDEDLLNTTVVQAEGFPLREWDDPLDSLKAAERHQFMVDRTREMHKALVFLNEKFEEMRLETRENRRKLDKQDRTLHKLREENFYLRCQLEEQCQYTRRNTVVISGVDGVTQENCVEIVKTIGDSLDIPITEGDIDIAHPIPTKIPGQCNIICKLVHRTTKKKLQEQARRKRINTNDLIRHHDVNNILSNPTQQTLRRNPLPPQKPGQSIYVNEQLTPYHRGLLYRVTQKKRARGWFSVFTDEGIIKVRKTQGARPMIIHNDDDLRNMD
jgi:hypothetical protein